MNAFVTEVQTPAFVVDERILVTALETAARLRQQCGCSVLYTLKPLAFDFLLELMNPYLDGFAVSSLFEARMARSAIDRGSVHITTPGFRVDEIGELDELCDFISFNSLSQLERLGGEIENPNKRGLRINPGLPLVEDDRYNPCRTHSKLGAPIASVLAELEHSPSLFDSIGGIHFHTNCDSENFAPIWKTARRSREASSTSSFAIELGQPRRGIPAGVARWTGTALAHRRLVSRPPWPGGLLRARCGVCSGGWISRIGGR